MEALVWSDYVCPWAYLGRHRTAVIEALGVRVVARPYELHPELPRHPEPPRPVRPGGRLAATFERVAEECRLAEVPFRSPSTSASTRLALELAEVVRAEDPAAFAPLDAALFAARFVEDRDLADPAVLRDVLVGVGVGPGPLERALGGAGRAAVDASVADARAVGATATPTWRFDNGFLLTGVHPVEQVQRWVGRMVARRSIEEGSGGAGRIPDDG